MELVCTDLGWSECFCRGDAMQRTSCFHANGTYYGFPSPEGRGIFIPLSGDNVLQSLFQAAVEGRFKVIGEKGDALPVRITGAPAEAQEFIDKGDFAGLTRYVQEMKKQEKAAMKAEKRMKRPVLQISLSAA